MHDHRALDAGAATPTAQPDDPLVGLASALERAARAYAAAVDRTDRADGGGPWVGEARGRVRSLLSECRAKAEALIDARAETRATSAAKRRALLRYWEVDIDCDPRAFRFCSPSAPISTGWRRSPDLSPRARKAAGGRSGRNGATAAVVDPVACLHQRRGLRRSDRLRRPRSRMHTRRYSFARRGVESPRGMQRARAPLLFPRLLE